MTRYEPLSYAVAGVRVLPARPITLLPGRKLDAACAETTQLDLFLVGVAIVNRCHNRRHQAL